MNRKRVQMLRNMMVGIPENRIVLASRYTKRPINPPEVDCGTVACMGGWANLYPPFIKMGIDKGSWEYFFGLLDSYGIPQYGLFFTRRQNDRGTDKEVALKRLDKLLAIGTASLGTAAK